MNPAPILQYMVKKTLKINRVRQRELSFFRQTCKFRFMRVSASLLLRCLSVLYVLYDLWDRFRMTHHSLSFTDSFFSFFCPHLPLTRSVWLAAPFAFQFRLVIFSSNTPQSADKWKCKLPLESQVQSFGEFCHDSYETHGLGKERWRNVAKKINIKFSFRFICDGYLVFGIFLF